jgi:hypothetical protein
MTHVVAPIVVQHEMPVPTERYRRYLVIGNRIIRGTVPSHPFSSIVLFCTNKEHIHPPHQYIHELHIITMLRVPIAYILWKLRVPLHSIGVPFRMLRWQ